MQANLRVLFSTLLIVFALGDDFNPYYTYADFNRTYPRTYTGDEWAKHEAAFIKNYVELVRLKKEGKDVTINDRLDWTDEQKQGTSIFIISIMQFQTLKLWHSYI